jgi:hypothetical protein
MLNKNILAKWFLLVVLTGFAAEGKSQNYMVLNAWRQVRHELSFGIGASNFLGELGGRDRIGTNFIYDLEKTLYKSAWTLNHRYYLGRAVALRHGLTYLKVTGDDKLTLEPFRNNRNLHFKSNIFQYSTLLEIQLMTLKDSRRHNLRNHKGRGIGWKYRSYGIYFFGGVGIFYFNPKASYLGQWVNLRDMHTEGQGLPDGPEPYKKYSFSIPVGGGFRMALNKQWAFTLELAHSFTFTDYIDDVSTVYYDNEAINAAYGSAAAYLANPSLNNMTHLGYDPTDGGYQRGDETDNDGFLYATFGMHYRLKNSYHPPGGSMKRKTRVRTIF